MAKYLVPIGLAIAVVAFLARFYLYGDQHITPHFFSKTVVTPQVPVFEAAPSCVHYSPEVERIYRARHGKDASKDLCAPLFLVTGALPTASDELTRLLRLHPDVSMARFDAAGIRQVLDPKHNEQALDSSLRIRIPVIQSIAGHGTRQVTQRHLVNMSRSYVEQAQEEVLALADTLASLRQGENREGTMLHTQLGIEAPMAFTDPAMTLKLHAVAPSTRIIAVLEDPLDAVTDRLQAIARSAGLHHQHSELPPDIAPESHYRHLNSTQSLRRLFKLFERCYPRLAQLRKAKFYGLMYQCVANLEGKHERVPARDPDGTLRLDKDPIEVVIDRITVDMLLALTQAFYFAQMNHWVRLFDGENQILMLVREEVRRAPAVALDLVTDFLGLARHCVSRQDATTLLNSPRPSQHDEDKGGHSGLSFRHFEAQSLIRWFLRVHVTRLKQAWTRPIPWKWFARSERVLKQEAKARIIAKTQTSDPSTAGSL